MSHEKRRVINARTKKAEKRTGATADAFIAMLEKKTSCQKCGTAITREERVCTCCGTENPYWMH